MKKVLILSLAVAGTLVSAEFNTLIDNIVTNHPDVKTKLSYYNSVKEDIAISKSYYKPTLDFQGTYGKEKIEYEDGTNNTNQGYYKHSLTLKQNIFEGFKTDSLVEQNEARLTSAAYSFLDQINTSTLESIKAYLDVLREKDLLSLYKENVANHEDIYEKIKERTNAGKGRKSEVQQTESRLYLAHSNLIVQQNNYQDTLTNFHYYAGKYFDFEGASKPDFNYSLPESLDDAQNTALDTNYAIKVMKSNVEAKRAEYKTAQSNFYPKLDAIASRDWEHNVNGVNGDKDTTKAYLLLSYNIYNGGGDEALKAKRLQEINEQNETLAKMKRDILKATRLSYVAYEMYKKQLEYLALHVKAAKETLESYNEEYNLGRRDLLAILDAQKEYITARQTYLRAEYDFLYAKYRILSAISNLGVSLKLGIISSVDTTLISTQLNDKTRFSVDTICDNDTQCSNKPIINIGYLQD